MRGITPDQLEAALIEAEATIARSRARQLVLLQVADAMQLPMADGARSLKEWVAGRLDVAPETASRLVGATRRLEDSPRLSKHLAEGEVTFDRAEATLRIPASERSEALGGVDIPGLRRLAAKYRRLTPADDHQAHISQHLQLQPNLDESRWDVWGELDAYGGAVVNKVLTEGADEIPDLPDGLRPGVGYRKAVALTNLCEQTRRGSPSTPLITVFVDRDGVEVESGTPSGPGVLDKIACSGALEIIKAEDGRPLSVGRKTRVISPRLRRFVLHRDGGCTADGCTSRYRLEPHHKIPWSEGGSTDAEGLTTLCWFHHHVVVHGWGYRIDPTLGPGRIRFIKPPQRGPPEGLSLLKSGNNLSRSPATRRSKPQD